VEKKILCVTSNFPRWSGDSTTPFVLELAKDLRRHDWIVDILAPHAPGAAKSELIDGVRVFRFQYLYPQALQTVCYQGGALINLKKNPLNYFALLFLVTAQFIAIKKLLSAGSYDLIHSHWILPQGFNGALAHRLTSIPHVLTVHGGDVFGLQGSLMEAFKKLSLRDADFVFFQLMGKNRVQGQKI